MGWRGHPSGYASLLSVWPYGVHLALLSQARGLPPALGQVLPGDLLLWELLASCSMLGAAKGGVMGFFSRLGRRLARAEARFIARLLDWDFRRWSRRN